MGCPEWKDDGVAERRRRRVWGSGFASDGPIHPGNGSDDPGARLRCRHLPAAGRAERVQPGGGGGSTTTTTKPPTTAVGPTTTTTKPTTTTVAPTTTAAPTTTVAPTTTTTASPTGGACPTFPANNPWNTDISTYPLHTRSAAWGASIGSSTKLHPDFGTFWDGAPLGIPFVHVGAGQTKVPMSFEYDDQSDPGPYPIPRNAPIEGGPSSDGDRHVLVIDDAACKLYELY